MNIYQKLKWLVLSGITETIDEKTVNRLVSVPENKVLTGSSVKVEGNSEEQIFSERARLLAENAVTLADLYQKRDLVEGCALKKTAAYTLNGYGAENPDVLCLTEGPETIDEKQGRLMSGDVGDLFRRMLKAIDLDLEKNAYVSALVPWRGPGNRKPTDVEKAICKVFWKREIELVQPKIILAFGTTVSEALTGVSALSKARNFWHSYQGIPVRVTVSLSTLIKQPAQRKPAWDDLQAVQEKVKDLLS